MNQRSAYTELGSTGWIPFVRPRLRGSLKCTRLGRLGAAHELDQYRKLHRGCAAQEAGGNATRAGFSAVFLWQLFSAR